VGRKKSVSNVDSALLAAAKRDLKELKGSKTATRLLALIAVGSGENVKTVSSVLQVTRQCVSRWIVRYRSAGIEGLHDSPKGHRRALLSVDARAEITEWITKSVDSEGKPIHWTIERLRSAIAARFGVGLSRTRVWQVLHAWGFRQKVPRPRHAAADKAKQEDFKKN